MAKRVMPKQEVVADEEDPELDETSNENEPVYLMVTGCKQLNVREEPNKSARILCTIPVNNIVLVDQVLPNWVHISKFGDGEHVSKNSQPGYIMSQYTKDV